MDYFKVIVENVLPVVIAILTPILLLLAKRLIVYLEKKWDFDMSDKMEAALMDVISRAVVFAEEKAMAAVKTGEDIPDGAQKLDNALEYAISEMKRLGLDELAKEKLAELIESKLFEKREKGEVPRTLKGPAANKKKLLTEG